MRPIAWFVGGLALLVALSLAVGATGGTAVAGDGAARVPAVDVPAVAEPTPGNGTTRHEDPRRADEAGDLAVVRDWFGGRMAVRLEGCVVEVGTGGTDVCELSEEYPAWLSSYIDIAEETDDRSDDGLGRTFDSAAESARTYDDAVASFRETHREYRAARAAGDRDRARRLARQLARDAATVIATSERLNDRFRTIENGTDADLADGRASLNATAANVTAVVATIEQREFVPTVLTAELAPRTVSFLEPGTLTGQLTSENGTPVANRTIALAVGHRRVETRTAVDGSFELSYRPTTLPRSVDELPVRYMPQNASSYLESETTVPVSVRPVAPDVTVDVRPVVPRFGDELTVTGRVAAADVGAPGVPVVVALEGRRLGTARTDETGAFAVTGPIAPVDGPGAVDVRATLALSDRALASADAAATVRVATTGTAMTLDASVTGNDAVDVSGTLRATGGIAVPDRRIAVRIDGTTIETLRTGTNGGFEGSVTIPKSLRTDAPAAVRIAATFDARGTNLEPANASAAVTLPARGGGGSTQPGAAGVLVRPVGTLPGDPPLWLPLALIGLLALLAGGYLGWRLWWRPVGPSVSDAPSADAAGTATDPTPSAPSALEPARARLADDPDGAVRLAYAAVREALAAGVGADRRLADTHWEFLSACRGDGLDEAAIAALTDLTEAYERAAYAPTATTPADASAALELADRLV